MKEKNKKHNEYFNALKPREVGLGDEFRHLLAKTSISSRSTAHRKNTIESAPGAPRTQRKKIR